MKTTFFYLLTETVCKNILSMIKNQLLTVSFVYKS